MRRAIRGVMANLYTTRLAPLCVTGLAYPVLGRLESRASSQADEQRPRMSSKPPSSSTPEPPPAHSGAEPLDENPAEATIVEPDALEAAAPLGPGPWPPVRSGLLPDNATPLPGPGDRASEPPGARGDLDSVEAKLPSVLPSIDAIDDFSTLDSRTGEVPGPGDSGESPFASMPTAVTSGFRHDGPVPTGGAAKLIFVAGNERGREHPLRGPSTSIGRGTNNDVVLTDIAVSRQHVLVIFDGAHHAVRDLSSGNGTLVNGVRIDGDAFIHDGDEIEIGNTIARFVLPAPQGSRPQEGEGRTPVAIPLRAAPQEPDDLPTPPLPAYAAAGETGKGLAFTPGLSSLSADAPFAPAPIAPPVNPSAYDIRPSRRTPLLIAGGIVAATAILIALIAAVTGGDGGRGERPLAAATTATPPRDAAGTGPLVTRAPATDAGAPSTPTGPKPPVTPPPTPAGPTAAVTPPAPRPPVTPTPKPRVEPPKPVSTAAAERTAESLYRGGEFSRAASTLRAAAASAGSRAEKLNAIAKDYAAVGNALDRAEANSSSSPGAAMAAFQQALALDSRSGKGAHGPRIRSRLAKLAPRAAAAHMASGRYEEARAACDAAVNYGSGNDPQVTKVRGQLSQKAKDFYNQGMGLVRRDPIGAKALFRRVLKIVPRDNPWYAKAYSALGSSSRREDEDE